MTKQKIQAPQPKMPADQAAASLAFATKLSEGLLPQVQPQQPQEAPQTPQDAPGQEKVAPPDFEKVLTTKLDEMRKELKADNQREIDELKKQIEDALNDGEQE